MLQIGVLFSCKSWSNIHFGGQGVMAYVILRPLMTLIAFIASLLGVLGDGQFRFDRVYLYTAFVNNFSQVRHKACNDIGNSTCSSVGYSHSLDYHVPCMPWFCCGFISSLISWFCLGMLDPSTFSNALFDISLLLSWVILNLIIPLKCWFVVVYL
jgi:Organic solute transporter Ostalpha